MKINLFEFAGKKNDVLSQLVYKADPIFVHLAKLYIFGYGNQGIKETRKHWQREIAKNLNNIPLVKKSKYLKRDVIFNKLKEVYAEDDNDLKAIIKAAINSEEQFVFNDDRASDLTGFGKVIDEYIGFLADSFSQSTSIPETKIYGKLRELGLNAEPTFSEFSGCY